MELRSQKRRLELKIDELERALGDTRYKLENTFLEKNKIQQQFEVTPTIPLL